MDVRELLEKVKSGEMSVEAGTEELKNLPYEDLGYAKLDLHRDCLLYTSGLAACGKLLSDTPAEYTVRPGTGMFP